MDDRAELGQSGERHAERFLRRRRYRTVTRNYGCPLGEIDLIALDGRTVVFVEIKTRTTRQHADPEEAVTPEKRRRISRAARCFLQQTGSQDRSCRFDVVTVTFDAGRRPTIEHFPDAFRPCS